jgi:hypothetical protein
MLPDRDDLAALYLLHKPFSAVPITLSDTLAVRAPIPWVMPFELGVVEPASCLLEVSENFQNLREPNILLPTPPLTLNLSPGLRAGVHQKAPRSSQFLALMPC